MQDPAKAQASARLVAAAADLATLELLYAHDAGTAAATDRRARPSCCRLTTPPCSGCRGWAAMLNGDQATALQQLSAAAETDPLAALGTDQAAVVAGACDPRRVRTRPQPHRWLGSWPPPQVSASQPSAQDSRAAAVRLLSAHPGELMGAVLF